MKVTRCDNCGAVLEDEEDAFPACNWLRVQFGIEREEHNRGEFCTAACAVAWIEEQRDEAAERDMCAMEENADATD